MLEGGLIEEIVFNCSDVFRISVEANLISTCTICTIEYETFAKEEAAR
jgi:hypothetical protein